jgi:hypothetical protein
MDVRIAGASGEAKRRGAIEMFKGLIQRFGLRKRSSGRALRLVVPCVPR